MRNELKTLLIIGIIILALPYIKPMLPKEAQNTVNNLMGTVNNMLGIFDRGSRIGVSVANDTTDGILYLADGNNPLNHLF